jgi:hypothetical protein
LGLEGELSDLHFHLWEASEAATQEIADLEAAFEAAIKPLNVAIAELNDVLSAATEEEHTDWAKIDALEGELVRIEEQYFVAEDTYINGLTAFEEEHRQGMKDAQAEFERQMEAISTDFNENVASLYADFERDSAELGN